MVLFESLDTVSYSHSVVTLAVSCIVSEIWLDSGRKARFFIPPSSNAPVWRNTGVRRTDRRTDGHTDGWTDILRQHSPCYA